MTFTILATVLSLHTFSCEDIYKLRSAGWTDTQLEAKANELGLPQWLIARLKRTCRHG